VEGKESMAKERRKMSSLPSAPDFYLNAPLYTPYEFTNEQGAKVYGPETPRLLAGDEHLPKMAQIEVREPEMCVTEWGIEWNGCPTYEDGRLGTGFRVHTSLLSWDELGLLEAELIRRQG
jgi:hypothetical protein